MFPNNRILFSILAVLSISFLQACSPAILGSGLGFGLNSFLSDGKTINITEQNYIAADMLAQQSRMTLTPKMQLQIGRLYNINMPGKQNAFGHVITTQIGTRFVQLGHNVNMDLYDGPIGKSFQPVPSSMKQSVTSPHMAVITGAYAEVRNTVLINLRIVDPDTGSVLSAYDYSLPLTGDVRELLKSWEERHLPVSPFGF